MFIGKRWRRKLLVVLLLALVWNKDKIFRWFEKEKPAGDVNIGVLVNDKLLSGNKEEEVAFAKSHLSENYHWVYVPDKFDGKVPVPWEPFTESTGFHFRLVSKKEKPIPELLARK